MGNAPKKSETSSHISPYWRTGWLEIDRIFDNFRRDFERSLSMFPAVGNLSLPTTVSCDVTDEGTRFVIHANMPGISKEDVKLTVTDNAVEISAEHRKEEKEEKKN